MSGEQQTDTDEPADSVRPAAPAPAGPASSVSTADPEATTTGRSPGRNPVLRRSVPTSADGTPVADEAESSPAADRAEAAEPAGWWAGVAWPSWARDPRWRW